MHKNEDLHIEEILSERDKDRRALELSLNNGAFYGFYAVMLIIIVTISVKLFILSVINKDFYVNRTMANVNREVYIPAPRGIIYDRFRNILAENKPSFSVSIKYSEFKNNQNAIRNFLKESINITDEDINNAIKNADLEESDLIILTSNINEDDVVKLKSNELTGLYIEDNFLRIYPYKDAFSHVVGYVDTENVGRSGLEASYDSLLNGVYGTIIRQYNAKGDLLDHKEFRKSIPGTDINTTLDAKLQVYFKNRLEQGLRSLSRTRGVGIALDPRTGEILSLISLPSFDSNIFSHPSDSETSTKKNELLNSNSKPFFNRAISGIYNPGSTIKPLVAIAALSENVITPSKQILSKGYIEIPNKYNPGSPSIYLDWKAHGWVDLRSAIARSSNIYFYAVGGGFMSGGGQDIGGENMVGLGILRLSKWWNMFGLGSKTNVDLLGENKGFLPNPEEKKLRTGVPWVLGDTYNISIGQGDLLITPLQLLNYIGAVANGGIVHELKINKNHKTTILSNITGYEDQFNEAREGMRDVVRKSYGSAHTLNDLPIDVAAKTGTAQIQNNEKINAFTVAFAPYENPEIAVLVLIEDAILGSVNTIPIARDVLEWYHENRIKNKNDILINSKNASSTSL